tara:strand:- start:42 stop:410 length:369 start_codon:yes stop_codon:yes gene_type:complete
MCVYLYTEDNLFQAVKKCKEQWEKLYCQNCNDKLTENGDDYDLFCETCDIEWVQNNLMDVSWKSWMDECDGENCYACGNYTERKWYRNTVICSCPEDDDCSGECKFTEEEGIFCGDCGEYCK